MVEGLALAFREALNVYEFDQALLILCRVRAGLSDADRATLQTEAANALAQIGFLRDWGDGRYV